MSKLRSLVSGLAVVFAIAMMPSFCLASHPNHISSAEVNWNPKSGNFEVALCVWPTDLEKALAIDQSKTIDLDKTENLDQMLQTYIEKRFLIRPSATKPSQPSGSNQDQSISIPAIRWVGHEHDHKTAWLYFEVEGDKQGARWTIENRVFFELNDDQINQIETKHGKSSEIVICTPGTARHSFDTRKTSSVNHFRR